MVKVVTLLRLEQNISKTAGDRRLVPIDHQQEMTIANRMVTWLMTSRESPNILASCPWPFWVTSRDPERSRTRRQYIWGPLSRQRLEIQTWLQWSTYIGNDCFGIKWSSDWCCHMTLKGLAMTPIFLGAYYLDNGWRHVLVYNAAFIENRIFSMSRSRARWHTWPKGQGLPLNLVSILRIRGFNGNVKENEILIILALWQCACLLTNFVL